MLPILYQSHDLILYSYPLLMGLGWGVGYQIYFSFPHSSRLKAQLLFWGIFLFAWIGAKALFLLTNPSDISEHAQSLNFWTGGGFVFYGGLIGGLLYIGIFKLIDKSFGMADLWPMVPAITLGHGIGRVGCFLAGCCFGKPTDWWWGIFLHNHYRHPTQLIEAIGLCVLGIYLLKSKGPRLFLIPFYFIAYGILRFAVELLRGDDVRGSLGLVTPSMLISLILVISGAGILLRNRLKPR